MDASISTALVHMIDKISDPVVIVLLILLSLSEWMRITQAREERADRNLLVSGLKEVTSTLVEIKIALATIKAER
jgi:hypothetical protein